MPYGITSATTKPTREFTQAGKSFNYFKIKSEAYTGYILTADGILIAEPEKALVDYLYFMVLGKKSLNDRLYIKSLNKAKLLKFARLFKRKKLVKLLKSL